MATEPLPPQASAADPIGRLKREIWFAKDAGETKRVQELQQQLGRLRTAQADDAGVSPQREDTAAAPPRRETTGAPTTSPSHRNRRSSHVPRK